MALMTTHFSYLFTEEESECIAKHVPWTRKLDETITLSPEGCDISLHDYLMSNKNYGDQTYGRCWWTRWLRRSSY